MMSILPEDDTTSISFLTSSAETASVDSSAMSPPSMPWAEYLAWVTAFGALVTVSVVGNSLVIWAVVWHRRMRTVTNCFLVNLALADLSMASFNVVFNCIYMLNSDWVFGKHYCTFNNFVAYLTVAASVFTLVAISADRYTAIMRPLQPRMSKVVATLTIMVVWFTGSILSLPSLLYSDMQTFRYGDGTVRSLCYLHWPDGPSVVSTLDYFYNIIFLIVTYLLPMLVITFTYVMMGRELWGSKGIGESSDRQVTNIKSKRRVVRMFIIVVVMFGICWLPYHVYFLVQAHLYQAEYVQHLYLAFYWLAMSSTMYSPIIYFRMNSRFEAYFKTAARCVLCCVRARPIDTSNNNLSVHSASTTNTNATAAGSLLHLGKWPSSDITNVLRCWSDRSLVKDDAECYSNVTNCETPNGTTTIPNDSRNGSVGGSSAGSATPHNNDHSPVTIIQAKPTGLAMFYTSGHNSDVIL